MQRNIANMQRDIVKEDDQSKHKHWTEGVVQEILVRLPVKSILRFKSTCKNWFALIRSRSFIEFHRQFQLLKDVKDHRHQLFVSMFGIISALSPSSSSSELTTLFDLRHLWNSLADAETGIPEKTGAIFDVHILGPLSDGIYCVVFQGLAIAHTFPPALTYDFCNIAFCNPATRAFQILSPLALVTISEETKHFGFGSVHKTGGNQDVADYKMIVINQLKSKEIVAYTYSLNGSGKLICDSRLHENNPTTLAALVDEHGKMQLPKIIEDLGFPNNAFLNESCHWITWGSDQKYMVLRFDMISEVFSLIPGPVDDYRQPSKAVRSGLFVFDDRLSAIVLADGPNGQVNVDVWLMMEYAFEKSWKKIYSSEFYLEGCRIINFLGMSLSSSGNDKCCGFRTIERMYFVHSEGKLISCDRSSFLTHCNFNPSWICWKPLGLAAYIETLERVDLEDMDDGDTS